MKSKDLFDSDDEDEEEENGQDGDDEEEKEEKDKKENEKKGKEVNDEDSKEEKNNQTQYKDDLVKSNTINLKEEDDEEEDKQKVFNDTLYGIFIMGLPYEATEIDLKKIFSKYGDIAKIKLPKYQNTNKNVGHCYIYYKNEKSAIQSLELDKQKLGKRYMDITLSKPITNHFKDKEAIDPDDVPLDCKTAFVKNLNYNITEQEVDEKFKTCGQINAIRFVYDNNTHKFKGFCYIDFKEHKGLVKALKLNGSFFGGRKIRVDYEQGKPKKGKLTDDNEELNLLNRKRY
jgi:RNA recognition motif-containing protein